MGQASPPALSFSRLQSGDGFSCGIQDDGSVVCWGDTAGLVVSGKFQSFTFEGKNVCGIRRDGSVICPSLAPVAVPSGAFRSFTHGSVQSCGVRVDGRLECWGGGYPPPTGVFRDFASGGGRVCGIDAASHVRCWTAREALPLELPATEYSSIALGVAHLCGLRKDHRLACVSEDLANAAVTPSGSFQSIAAGAFGTCGLRSDGSITCWGSNDYEQIELPSGPFRSLAVSSSGNCCGVNRNGEIACSAPGALFGSPPYRSVSPGSYFGCAVTEAGTLDCSPFPVAPGETGFRDVATLDMRIGGCAIREDRSLLCWSLFPSKRETLAGSFLRVAASTNPGDSLDLCALTQNGRIECWGTLTRPRQE